MGTRTVASIFVNYVLQLAGDPRLWPRPLCLPRERLLWRQIYGGPSHDHEWPPSDATERLRGLAEAQLQEAKFWYLLVTYTYVIAAAVAGAAYVRHEGLGRVNYLPLTAIALQIVAVVTRLRAFRLHTLGHQADWKAMLMDGLGATRHECEDALMLENLLTDAARSRSVVMKHYYATSVPRGPRRLALNLRETTFFTGTMYRSAANRVVWFAFIVIVTPFLLPLYKVIAGKVVPSAFVVVAITALLPLWDVIGRIRSWRTSARVLEEITVALAGVDTLDVIMPLMLDAVVATATAPLIPRTIYATWSKEQRERWQVMCALEDVPVVSRDMRNGRP